MSEAAIQAKIELAVRRRQDAWAVGEPELAREVGERIDELYGELREERARNEHGSRPEITKRARIELELEKLADA